VRGIGGFGPAWLRTQFRQHRFHFGLCMQVAGTAAEAMPSVSIFFASSRRSALLVFVRHEVAGSIVGVSFRRVRIPQGRVPSHLG